MDKNSGMSRLFKKKKDKDVVQPAQNTSSDSTLIGTNALASMSTSPQDERPYGPLTLRDPKDPDIDIVFVHGLQGDRQKTWTHSDNQLFWPRDLLPEDLPTARIITWGYPADIAKALNVVSVATVSQHTQDLFQQLANIRHDVNPARPMIFIAHSMGGIVAKKTLLNSKDSNEAELKSIAKGTCGVLFMGTPHSGSGHANLANILAKMLNVLHPANISYADELKKQSPELYNLEQRFHGFLEGCKNEGHPIEVQCFCETVPMGKDLVVPPDSAAPPHYRAIGIHETHTNMVKFHSKDDQNYRNVLAELKRIISERQEKGDDAAPVPSSATYVGDNTKGAMSIYGTISGASGHIGNNNTFN